MSNVISGMDALNALNDTGESTESTEFTKFSSGTEFIVKVIGKEVEVDGETRVIGDFISYFNYGIYKKVNSFVAKNPSKKSAKGYPVENLTPWDKAWKYHADRSKEFNDYHSKESYKYKPKQKFVFGFIDLDSGEPILIDLTKKQAQAVSSAIQKFGKRRGEMAFELSKTGESTGTVVSLSPYLDDLTDKQQENFDKAPDKFDEKLFESVLFEVDEEEQIKLLVQAGFDVSLIGLDAPKEEDSDEAKPIEGVGSGPNGEITDDDLPF